VSLWLCDRSIRHAVDTGDISRCGQVTQGTFVSDASHVSAPVTMHVAAFVNGLSLDREVLIETMFVNDGPMIIAIVGPFS
jgi:hypothetical protein